MKSAVGARLVHSPTLVDWLPVVVLPPILVVDAAVSGYGVDVAGVAAAFVGCAPLIWRRRLRFLQLSPLIVAGIVLILWQLHPASTVVLIPMVALYELARRGTRRQSLWMSVGVVPCVVVSVVPFTDGLGNFAQVVVRNVAFCLLAIAAGEVLRSGDEAAERAAVAREQEALRQVGEERLRIAQEVHDVVAHAMVAINVQAGVAAHLLEHDPDHARAALKEIKQTSGDALTDLRGALGVLRDPGGSSAPVGPASGLGDLAELAANLRAAGIEVALAIDELPPVPAAVHAAGYRIVQEALTNVLRHARATRAEVRVWAVGDVVRVEVTDDGAAASRAIDGSGHGVRGMRERAAALGGTLESGPVPGSRGWRVSATLPVAPTQLEATV
jgi:signal transduction histidine kinase